MINAKNIPIRVWYATLAIGCFGLISIGLQLQEIYKLVPCPMCIFQRFLYLTIGVLSIIGWAYPKSNFLLWRLIFVLALVGIGVAGEQSWMQAYPELAKECGFTNPNMLERFVDWLGSVNPDLFLATGFCTSKDWVFLSLSMANWSVLVFIAILAYVFKVFNPR